MPISSAIIVPHPPLLIPDVGNGQERIIQDTIDSYHKAAKVIASHKPETIILISPHAVSYSDYIHIAPGKTWRGHLKQFGSNVKIEAPLDTEFVKEVCRLCNKAGLPAGTLGGKSPELDHGTTVPLYFINQYYSGYRLVIRSLSGLPRQEQYRFGIFLKEASEHLGRKTAIIASGDLSHKLKESGPYHYAKEGPELDRQLTEIMKSGDFIKFLTIDEELCHLGAECGLGSFVTMAGILDKMAVEPEFLSYEGPFGVGYAVCIFSVLQEDAHRNFFELYLQDKQDKQNEIRQNEDIYVRLARETLEHYVRTDRMMELPPNLPNEMISHEAGTFVSIKKNGQLRGCIGTTAPTQSNAALEIMYNAISSGTRDPRFPRVLEDELDDLVYNVDVLTPAETILNKDELDPKRFGVIVSKGKKRGLLLPDLEGVDTIGQQLEIACQKAGITPSEEFNIERFKVIRHF